MKRIIILLLFPLLTGCSGRGATPSQAREADVAATIDKLMEGFVNADENVLMSLTSEDLVYGHSTGAVQNRAEFIAEIANRQPLAFLSIELPEQTIRVSGDTAVVQHVFTARTEDTDGHPGQIRIGAMQVWLLRGGQWILLARQGYRL